MVLSLAAIAIALALFGAAGAAAQSAGDRQYADPLAGGGQQEPRQSPATPDGGDAPSTPAPAPTSPAPSGSGTGYGTPTPAPASGATLPHTGAEPVPIVATGLLLLLGGGLLRQRTLRRAAS